MMGRSRVVALLAAVAVAFSLPAGLGARQGQMDQKRSKEEQREIEQLVKTVDQAMTSETVDAGTITMSIEPYFLKSQDKLTLVPFKLRIENAPAADVALYLRVVDPAAWAAAKDKSKVEYPWDDIHFIPKEALAADASPLSRVFMAPAGTYDVYLAIRERVPEKAPRGTVAQTGLLKTQVTVPDFWSPELQTSTLIVTDSVTILKAPLEPDQARERPFVFGVQEMVPADDAEFRRDEELAIWFQVYNSGLDAAGKPNLTMEYNFHRTQDGKEEFFNKTSPQEINASTLPPQFDPATFPVPGGISVPLTRFPEGQFRLEIKVTDKTTGKILTHDVKFTVVPA